MRRELKLRARPAVEGVRLTAEGIMTTVVRNRKGDMTVRVDEVHSRRASWERFPLVRGIVRLFAGPAECLSALSGSEALQPVSVENGTRAEAYLSRLFRVPPEKHSARLSGLLMLLIVFLLMAVAPYLLDRALSAAEWASSGVLDAITCVARLIALDLTVLLCSRLRVLRRLGRWRAAAGRVINAYEIYGPRLTESELSKSTTVTTRSDGVFLMYTLRVAMIAAVLLPAYSVGMRALMRIPVLLGSAAAVGEVQYLLENAKPRTLLAMLRSGVMRCQRLWLGKPDEDMSEVALCAFHVLYERLEDRGGNER